jgi:hypothetical protein
MKLYDMEMGWRYIEPIIKYWGGGILNYSRADPARGLTKAPLPWYNGNTGARAQMPAHTEDTTMEYTNELKNTLHGAWLDTILGMPTDEQDSMLDSFCDQISGYLDMCMEDADLLDLEISDADTDEWTSFVVECAKEFLVRWLIGNRYPDADTLTIADIVELALEFDGLDMEDMVDSYMDR